MDELFPIPASEPNRLTVARQRYEAARDEWSRAEAAPEELPVVIPRNVMLELRDARCALQAAELADISARKIERNAGAAD